jgi:hypothetical protein
VSLDLVIGRLYLNVTGGISRSDSGRKQKPDLVGKRGTLFLVESQPLGDFGFVGWRVTRLAQVGEQAFA